MAEYKVFKQGKEMPSNAMARDAMLDRVDKFLERGDEGKVWYKHRDPQKNFRPVERMRERVRNLTRSASTGSRILVELKGIDDTLVIVKVENQGPYVPDLGCHPEIEKAHAWLWDRFGEKSLRSAGRWYCKFVSGTTIVSKHGYLGVNWRGAAEDVFGEGSMNNMEGLFEMAHFLVRKVQEGQFTLDTVICGDRIWKRGVGWGKYTGVFHTHIHMDVSAGSPCSP